MPMKARPDYCPCENDAPDPCPACGATIEGNDEVRGICQARHGYKPKPYLSVGLVDKETGEWV